MLLQTLHEINHQAIAILCREIGVVNTLRFIHQFSPGYGNYTLEREALLEGKTLNAILLEIKQNKLR